MICIGVDVGSIGIKAAAVGSPVDDALLRRACGQSGELFLPDGDSWNRPILLSRYRRILGEPARMSCRLIQHMIRCFPPESIAGIRVTGTGGQSLAGSLGVDFENDFRAVACGVGALYPRVRTIIEMGGNSSKYTRISVDEQGHVGISDFGRNGDCAAGTGAFIDQQATRLRYRIEEVGELVRSVEAAASIAGRCTVFSKTDMVHAQQKGYTPPQILKGLCEAVVRNFKGTVIKGKRVVGPVAVVGGMAANSGIIRAIQELFDLQPDELIVPVNGAWMSAIGAAVCEAAERESGLRRFDAAQCARLLETADQSGGYECRESPPLSTEKVTLLRDRARPYSFEGRSLPVDAFLGIDVGSVSTNLAVIDRSGDLIDEEYLRTDSRPIEIAGAGLGRLKSRLGDRIRILGVGATGSGRELVGELVGADVLADEITAHKTGAVFVAQGLLNRGVDTIFEIGGQDAKFIRLDQGVVVDFSMNEACSAGTGSFLEEQAERLGISIETDFASVALASRRPVSLGERCTVFMEMDLINHLQHGAEKGDLAAGLAYSVALNYLHRVVRGRKIGDVVFFQGGTAYNDAVAAAFSVLLNKEIVVPPHNGVMGAIGAALLACRKASHAGVGTRFRGYEIDQLDFALREFTCRACSNLCGIQEFRVQGEKTYWGDRCSDRFRKRPRSDSRPVIEDLFAYRERLFAGDGSESAHGPRIGLPRGLYYYEYFPFWHAYLRGIDCRVVVSEPTSQKTVDEGIEATVAEPCFPIQVTHGHIRSLVERGAEYIFMPNLVNAMAPVSATAAFHCPWGQTLPFVLASAQGLAGLEHRMLTPTIHFQSHPRQVRLELREIARGLGVSERRSDRAAREAFEAQRSVAARLARAGREALQETQRAGRMALVMMARPYTMHDRGANMNLPGKLRQIYGVNVIPMDCLDLEAADVSSIHDNMFWNYGRKILQAALLASRYLNLHLLFVTNYRCGPDSFIKHWISRASNRPFLTVQLDGHRNDAGVLTRCEAYLASKGFL